MWVADCTQGDNVGVCAPVANTSCNFEGAPVVGADPLGLAFDGVYMWVTNHGANSVTRWMASSTPSVAFSGNTYPVGTAPF
jgi:hypothetical protein